MKLIEPSWQYLDRIWEKYKPQYWFFGHFHQYLEGVIDDCHWVKLGELGSEEKGWTELLLYYED